MSSNKHKQYVNQARVTQSFEEGLAANSQEVAMGFPAPEKTDLMCGCFPRRRTRVKWLKYQFGKKWKQACENLDSSSP